jgi:DNA-binding NarL/FixJ family response regulator
MIRILVADDHALMRKGLIQLFALETDITVVGEASNGLEVLHWISEQSIDLLLLDMTMEGVSGAELIKRIKAIRPNLPILMLSMHKVSQIALLALKSGADGYITKDSEPENLLTAIRKVAKGGKYITPVLAENIAYNIKHKEQILPHGQLSIRELEVFRLLVAGSSINEIALQLNISNKTVSTYKTRILEKMDLQNVTDLVRYAVQYDMTNQFAD